MDLKDFKESLDRNIPPEDLGRALQALWYQVKGEWDSHLLTYLSLRVCYRRQPPRPVDVAHESFHIVVGRIAQDLFRTAHL